MKRSVMTNYAFLGLGTNLGAREVYLDKAIQMLESSAGRIDSLSGIYETEPWGFESTNKFLNMIVRVQTELNPYVLLKQLQSIEDQLGRVRNENRYSSRTIDIDILLYGNKVINKPGLTIPHPMISERRFVLVPLCDIAPDLVHPVLRKTFAELLEACQDEKAVRRYHPL